MRFKGTTLSEAQRWQVFDEAFTDGLAAAAEYARYEWHWRQRTQWLADHSMEKETALWQERRDKRQQMTERMNERRESFLALARVAQACAMCLGEEAKPRLREDYHYDLTRTGDGFDTMLRQWAYHLTFDPTPVPF